MILSCKDDERSMKRLLDYLSTYRIYKVIDNSKIQQLSSDVVGVDEIAFVSVVFTVTDEAFSTLMPYIALMGKYGIRCYIGGESDDDDSKQVYLHARYSSDGSNDALIYLIIILNNF